MNCLAVEAQKDDSIDFGWGVEGAEEVDSYVLECNR